MCEHVGLQTGLRGTNLGSFFTEESLKRKQQQGLLLARSQNSSSCGVEFCHINRSIGALVCKKHYFDTAMEHEMVAPLVGAHNLLSFLSSQFVK